MWPRATLQDSVTKVAGQHTFKSGFEIIRTSFNSLAETLLSGIYMGATDNPFTPNTGNDFAALVLERPPLQTLSAAFS